LRDVSAEPDAPRVSSYRHRVRYLEIDQQGVVFNMWYLGYFDEAMGHFLEEGGLPYTGMLDEGFDVQLVRSEIDWRSSLRWPEEARIDVSAEEVGRTSFVLRFEVHGESGHVATGRTVYVVIATHGSGKRPIPDFLLAALGKTNGPA
jgi:acyl-CoA thioester hydrolase